jgi:hypothetical protein
VADKNRLLTAANDRNDQQSSTIATLTRLRDDKVRSIEVDRDQKMRALEQEREQIISGILVSQPLHFCHAHSYLMHCSCDNT